MLQPSPVPAASLVDRLRTEAGPRALGIILALLIEALLLFLLFSFRPAEPPGDREKGIAVVTLEADAVSEKAPEPNSPRPEQKVEERPVPPKPQTEPVLPPPPVVPKVPSTLPAPPPPQPAPSTPTPPNNVRAAPSVKRLYGPPDKGGFRYHDTERVGTAPNGEPLYAAAWYREPDDKMLGDYLSTSRGPGWGLIACRTAPGYRVQDCVGLDEYPQGSQITRSVLAAAWEFRVRPPQRGGVSLVGSWVRIRIDYSIRRN